MWRWPSKAPKDAVVREIGSVGDRLAKRSVDLGAEIETEISVRFANQSWRAVVPFPEGVLVDGHPVPEVIDEIPEFVVVDALDLKPVFEASKRPGRL